MESTLKTQPTMANYRRKSRYPSDETKKRISTKLTGRKLSSSTKELISQKMKQYWENFPADHERHEGTGDGWIETGDII